MRRLFLILCCLVAVASPPAFAAPAQHAYRVTFKDKQGAPQLSGSPAWLSARSMTRRAAFGVALDSTDRPVSPLYIATVLQLTAGVLHNTSRWLNYCVVLLTDSSKIHLLEGQPFIRSIEYVAYFEQGLHMRTAKADNPKFAVENASLSGAKIAGSATYYGNTYTQTSLVHGDYLHDLGYRGAGKLIAVIDEGFIDVNTHRGFDSLRTEGRLLETYNFKVNTNAVYLDDIHGMQCLSAMAGLIPGTYVGSAPKAQYALYTTEDDDFTDAFYELDNLIAAIERADSIGADVISASIVYNIFINPYNYTFLKGALDGHTTIVARAVNMAVAKGIFYTSSAGNEGGNWWDFLDSPGDADSALTVGSVLKDGTVSSFSSPGPNASGRVKPDICMLGDPAAVFGPGNGIIGSGGTSFAAPQAAGYAALLIEAFPKVSLYQIRMAIIRSADRYLSPTPKRGYGIPDFKRAYEILLKESPSPDGEILVQPNPFNQSFNIRVPTDASIVELTLYDMAGRKVAISAQRMFFGITLSPISPLPTGIYMLHAVVNGKTHVLKLTHL